MVAACRKAGIDPDLVLHRRAGRHRCFVKSCAEPGPEIAEKWHYEYARKPLSVRAQDRLPIGRTERPPRFDVGPPVRIEILCWSDRVGHRGAPLNLLVGVWYAIGNYPSPRESLRALVDSGCD